MKELFGKDHKRWISFSANRCQCANDKISTGDGWTGVKGCLEPRGQSIGAALKPLKGLLMT